MPGIRAGCAVAGVLHKHGVKGVGLKWPNDLQVAGHKVGGILVEIQGDPTGHCRAVVGLGLNLKTPTRPVCKLISLCRSSPSWVARYCVAFVVGRSSGESSGRRIA